jgi:cytidylate kinase
MSDAAASVDGMMAKGARGSTGVPRIIAIDGPSAAGKSTVGRMIAEKLGYRFIDTGAIYRALTWAALRRGVDVSDENALSDLAASIRMDVGPSTSENIDPCAIFVDGEDVTEFLRRPVVESAVSLVSRVAGVRAALLTVQRDLAGKDAVVMAGRDIGSVVLPEADLKVYLDCSIEERAHRRFAELSAPDVEATQEGVLRDLRRRDQIDSERSVSPLRPAEGAIVLDTDGLSLQEVVERLSELVEGSP